MLVNDKGAYERLNSPGNLINQIRNGSIESKRKNAMSLFIPPQSKPLTPERSFLNPFSPKEGINNDSVVKKENLTDNAKVGTGVASENVAPVLSQLIDNADTQVQLGLAHDNALKLLNKSVDLLTTKLDDIKPEKLPAVVGAASKVVESIRKERNEAAKSNKDREVHFHFYTPQQKTVSDYEIIELQP